LTEKNYEKTRGYAEAQVAALRSLKKRSTTTTKAMQPRNNLHLKFLFCKTSETHDIDNLTKKSDFLLNEGVIVCEN